MENEINDEIQNICKEILKLYQDYLNHHGISATHHLADSATYQCRWQNDVFEIVFNLESYWRYIESGTSPHFPPVDAIMRWITVKKLVPRAINGRVPTTKSLAFAICNSINKNGTKAQLPLTKSLRTPQADMILQKLVDTLFSVYDTSIDEQIEKL